MSDYVAGNPEDGYDAFRAKCEEVFAANAKSVPVFHTNLNARIGEFPINTVWDNWLSHLPEENRQHYNCWTCQSFFNRFAELVIINADGSKSSAFMPALEEVPAFFRDAVEWLTEMLQSSKVVGIYYPGVKTQLGNPESLKGWTHFTGTFDPTTAEFKLKGEAHQYTAITKKFIEDLLKVPESSWKNVQLMLDAGKFDDSIGKSWISWLLQTHKWFEENKSKDNFSSLLWLKLAYVSIDWINFRSGSVGRLLETSDTNPDAGYMEYLRVTDPKVHSRAQKEASDNQLKVAMAKIEKLGLSKAFYRRPARVDELRYLWQPVKQEESAEVETEASTEESVANPFAAALAKRKEPDNTIPGLDHTVDINFQRFWNHVLPKALSLRVRPIYRNRLMPTLSMTGFMTSVYPDAPRILKSDLPDDRYPVSEWQFAEPQPPVVWLDEADIRSSKWFEVAGITRASSEIREPFDFNSEKLQYGYFVIKEGGLTTPTQAALFPDDLIPELYDIRAAIEDFSVKAAVEHPEKRGNEATAFHSLHSLLVEVTMESGTVIYKLI